MPKDIEKIAKLAAETHFEVQKRLRLEGGPVGFSVLLSIAKDTKAANPVRVDAAKALLSLSGHVAPRAEQRAADSKDMSEMSQAELRKVIDQCETQLAAKAKPINAPLPDLSPAQDDDMFD